MLGVEMSKFRYQTEKSKYCRKSSNECIFTIYALEIPGNARTAL